MKKYLLLLTIGSSPLAAMELSSLKPTYLLNRELLEAVEKTDTTANQVYEILYNGADANARGWDGNTALIKAAKAGNPEACEALLQRGALINLTNKVFWLPSPLFAQSNMEPLHYATSFGHPDVCEVLVKHRADIFSRANIFFNDSSLGMGIYTWLGQLVVMDGTILAEIEDGNFKRIYETLIKHAWVLPIPENVDASLKCIVTAFLSLQNWEVNGQKLPNELIYLILLSNQELRDQICDLLIPAVRQNKKIPDMYQRMVSQVIYSNTLSKIHELLKEIHVTITRTNMPRLQNQVKPELLELELGEQLQNNIQARLKNP